MKTKTLLQTTGLTILMMLLTTFYSNAQIQIQGLAVDHEGIAGWDTGQMLRSRKLTDTNILLDGATHLTMGHQGIMMISTPIRMQPLLIFWIISLVFLFLNRL